jgi:hypothetical protein
MVVNMPQIKNNFHMVKTRANVYKYYSVPGTTLNNIHKLPQQPYGATVFYHLYFKTNKLGLRIQMTYSRLLG